ncbi:C2H2 type zinc finger domain protein [Colletotrichum karsti]|uniref:C2H2 type zinc finger domain protein n=1 Tax=Colletotrichum karsti TaxID=1095194 RepID=A0A9P6I2Y9_9PEZI|nr:C2H2 type zinc finger domain protein [Colletotrichum karsti]KAF9875493.1 C2H2 type zinc finger domain protein [Colletotrichum karsti]
MKRSREDEEEPFAADNDRNSPAVSLDEGGSRATKIAELETSAVSSEDFAMRCSLPPHRDAIAFKSYDEYEAHYIKTHTNRCLECGRNLPSEHLLNVHHEECHDSFAAVKRERGEHTYSCFVEGCERKCMTPQKRRMHLIDKHMYPKNFFFAVTKEGIDGRRSLLVEGGHHRRKSSTAVASKESKRKSSILESSSTQGETKMEVDEKKGGKEARAASSSGQATQPTTQPDPTERPDTDMEDLAGAMSALQFVPNSVRFGRGGGRAGFAKR